MGKIGSYPKTFPCGPPTHRYGITSNGKHSPSSGVPPVPGADGSDTVVEIVAQALSWGVTCFLECGTVEPTETTMSVSYPAADSSPKYTNDTTDSPHRPRRPGQ
jgi:hypothetical protein